MKKLIPLLLLAAQIFGCSGNEKKETYAVTIIDSTHHALGEGALWDARSERLFYVDILGKKLYVYEPSSGTTEMHEMPSMPGTVVVNNDNEVLVALEDGIYRYQLDNRQFKFLFCPPQNDSTQRFNDGKCDPAGRFWVGTMSLRGKKEQSHLFCMENDTSYTIKLDGISVSNGIAWSSDKKHMYYTDTPTRKVMEFTYDEKTGNISRPRVAVSVHDSLGAPDGMAIDADDNLWICMWGGSAVCCFDPASGELIDRIIVPARNVTSCTFAGEQLHDLYITTARTGTSEEELSRFPDAGSLFKVTLKYSGTAPNRYSVNNRVF